MSMARTVIVASFENPASACEGETCVHGPKTTSATRIDIAVTSGRTTPVRNSANAATMTPKTTSMPVVTDGTDIDWASTPGIMTRRVLGTDG